MPDIYCIKLKQTRLYGKEERIFSYFPFDRFYLVPEKHRSIALNLFRYSLVLRVNDVIKENLAQIKYQSRREIDIKRDNTRLSYRPVSTPQLPEIQELRENEWLLVVPTYLARNYEMDPESRKPVTKKARLAYTLTSAVWGAKNTGVPMPTVMLHTPKEDIPVLCAICKNVANYHANQCTPGQDVCRRTISLTRLPVDEEFRTAIETSVASGGEIQ